MVSKSHEHLQLERSMEYSQLLLNVGVYWKELKKKKKPFSGKGKGKMLAKRTQAANAFKKAMEADVHAKGRLIVEDVSEGLEPVALKAFCSTVTTMPVAHEEFTYMTKNSRHLSTKVKKGSLDLCYDCVDRCGENCACVIASFDNGHSFMTQTHFIFLIGPHDCDTSATFVCGPMCACRSDCSNRAPEQATSPWLELFRHNPILGMGVRTTKKLSIGEIAYEFTGRICTKPNNKFYAWTTHVADDKAVSKKKNGKDVKHLEGYELILSRIFKKSNLPDMVEDICIDPFDSGNIGRFVSHSEFPNVVPMKVFENDLRPQSVRLFFVAIREIFPGEEIFCDYGGYYKGFKTCLCGSPACKPARSHLLKFGKEKALETLLKFQHRKRDGGPDLTRLNFQGDQGDLFLQKARRLISNDEQKAKDEIKAAEDQKLAKKNRQEQKQYQRKKVNKI